MDHTDWVRSELKPLTESLGFRYTPREELEDRLSRLRGHMERAGIESLLVVQKMDLFYLSGDPCGIHQGGRGSRGNPGRDPHSVHYKRTFVHPRFRHGGPRTAAPISIPRELGIEECAVRGGGVSDLHHLAADPADPVDPVSRAEVVESRGLFAPDATVGLDPDHLVAGGDQVAGLERLLLLRGQGRDEGIVS